jgi:uracil-DNA glycosylase family 4
MPTRNQLFALTEELRRLKAGGQRNISVSDAALEQLRTAVREVVAGPMSSVQETPTPLPRLADKPSPAVYVPPRAAAPAAPTLSPAIPSAPPPFQLPTGDKATRWDALHKLVLNDPVCLAHVHPGKKIVLGVGNLDATIFFCGEAPGAEEETQGEPFVGPAGQLLTRMIQGMGLKREQVYIGNIMNWRPDIPGHGGIQIGNRAPTAQEMNYCLPYLKAQIEIVQPELIVALGATAAGGLLGAGTFKTLGEIKGRWHEFAGKPVMVTYHPSYILRNNSNRSKRGIWEDLLKVMERARLPVSEKQRNFFL